MDEADKRRLGNLALAALGITAVGLALGLKRFLWRLWIVVSFLWGGLLLLMLPSKGGQSFETIPWGIIVGPPILLLLVAGILAWIIDGLFGDVSDRSH